MTSPDLSGVTSYKMVKAGNSWFGFLVNRSANKIVRLDFGADPTAIPTIVDLGNPAGLLNAPDVIDLYNHNGEWFGFVGYNGDVVRLEFGTSIENSSPSATRLNLTGPKRFPDVKIIEQEGQLIVLAVVFQDNAIRRLNFGSAFRNAPAVTEIPVSTVEFPLGISVVRQAENWIVHLTSFVQNGTSKFSITQLNFGTNIFSAPVNEGHYNLSGLNRPHRIRMQLSGGEYFGFVSNESKKISIINFHDLDPDNPPIEIAANSLPSAIGFDLFRHEGRVLIHAAEHSSGSLKTYAYENSCGESISWSIEREPADLKYTTAGVQTIDLTIASDDFKKSEISRNLTVGMNASPDVTISNDFVCVATAIEFSGGADADNVTTWSWDFGNGQTSGFERPSVTYDAPGTYEVSLALTAENGCSARSALDIEIFPKPIADFLFPAGLICTNNDLTFAPTGADVFAGYLSYQWYVDGAFESAERNLVYRFTTTGPREISLVMSLPGCLDEITRITPAVEAGPVVDFSHSGLCENDTFRFAEEITDPVETLLWNFGNDHISTAPDPEIVFGSSGEFLVSLMATNALGCENVRSKMITVQALPVVDFQVAGPPNACSGTSALFQNQSTHPDGIDITEWLWAFDDEADPGVETSINPRHTFAEPGTYQVSLTATTSAGCGATLAKSVVIEQSPSKDFAFTPACDDQPVHFSASVANVASWYWEVETAYYETASPTHTFRSPGSYPVFIEMTGTNHCVSAFTRAIHVPIPLSPVFSVLRNCVDQETVFTDLTNGTDPVVLTEWKFSDGFQQSGNPLTRTFTTQGNKQVSLKVTTEAGCAYQTDKMVTVVPSPVADFTAAPANGAFPLEVNFANTSMYATAFLWEFGDVGNATSTETSPTHVFTEGGSFEVTLKAVNEHQCEGIHTEMITTVAPFPDADIEMIAVAINPDGSTKMIITLHNKGNTILKDLPVDIDFQGQVVLRQVAPQLIMPSSKYNLVFNTSILGIEDLQYVCATISLAGDVAPDGNRLCQEFRNSLVVFPGYPNPAAGAFHLEWISPLSTSARVTVADALGRKMLAEEYPVAQGFNQLNIDLSMLQDGIYFLVLEQGAAKHLQRILVSH